MEEGKHGLSLGKTRGNKFQESDWLSPARGFEAGKTRLAKGYLGLQGSDDETGAMDESEKSLPCGEDVGSNCKRFEAQSINLAFESL